MLSHSRISQWIAGKSPNHNESEFENYCNEGIRDKVEINAAVYQSDSETWCSECSSLVVFCHPRSWTPAPSLTKESPHSGLQRHGIRSALDLCSNEFTLHQDSDSKRTSKLCKVYEEQVHTVKCSQIMDHKFV